MDKGLESLLEMLPEFGKLQQHVIALKERDMPLATTELSTEWQEKE